MRGVGAGGYYDPAGASVLARYTYLLGVFIIPATGIFIVTQRVETLGRPIRGSP